MSEVELYFYQVWDKNGTLHELKTVSLKEVIAFAKKYKGPINGFNQGSRKVPKSKLQHCIDNVSIENLMTLKKEEE